MKMWKARNTSKKTVFSSILINYHERSAYVEVHCVRHYNKFGGLKPAIDKISIIPNLAEM